MAGVSNNLISFLTVLLYPGISVVQNLPLSNTPLTVEKYKCDLLKPFSKMYFWVCAKDDFESAKQRLCESDMLTKSAFEACFNSSAVARDVLWILTSPKVAIRSTCPDLLNKASTSGTSYHQYPTRLVLFTQSEIKACADAHAEAWVDPIEDPNEIDDTLRNEVELMEDATETLREPLDINLGTIPRNEVSNNLRLHQCQLTNRVSIRHCLMFQDYMDTRKKKWFKPKAMLKVYVGEPAVDDGGPKLVFFYR